MSSGSKLNRREMGLLLAAPFLLQEPFKITDNVELVLLDVSVRDKDGSYITDLPQGAFNVTVDGKAQTISHFSSVDSPVTLGLIVDTSGSMRSRRPELIVSGLAFVKASNPKDEFFVVNFNDRVWLGLPPGVHFTDELQLLRNALHMGEVGGQTALYDAIALGLQQLEQGHQEKRTLIVVSDGGDNASRISQNQLLSMIEVSRATIYAIGLVDPDNNDLRPAVLKKFANVSGGQYFQPKQFSDVIGVLERISKDIRTRYSIGFAPNVTKETRQPHMIHVTASSNGKLIVRTRTTYRTDEPKS